MESNETFNCFLFASYKYLKWIIIDHLFLWNNKFTPKKWCLIHQRLLQSKPQIDRKQTKIKKIMKINLSIWKEITKYLDLSLKVKLNMHKWIKYPINAPFTKKERSLKEKTKAHKHNPIPRESLKTSIELIQESPT